MNSSSSTKEFVQSTGGYELEGVHLRPLEGTRGLVYIAQPHGVAPDITRWFKAHERQLEDIGATRALLLRGFDVPDRAAFRRILDDVLTPMSYIYRSTPRTEVGDRVYTATEYPASRTIPLHCENSYQDVWPACLMFYCERAPDVGGETPLADVVEITRMIPEAIKQEFRAKKIKYIRNYRVGVDLSWQTVFQARSRAEVEAYCEAHNIRWAWIGEDLLRTEQVCEAMLEHPQTGELLWFNQAHLFHVSALDERTRSALLSLYAVDELPRHATFADGAAIDDALLFEIRLAFDKCACAFPWLERDTLYVDNLLVAHGRNPFSGERSILVGMGNR